MDQIVTFPRIDLMPRVEFPMHESRGLNERQCKDTIIKNSIDYGLNGICF